MQLVPAKSDKKQPLTIIPSAPKQMGPLRVVERANRVIELRRPVQPVPPAAPRVPQGRSGAAGHGPAGTTTPPTLSKRRHGAGPHPEGEKKAWRMPFVFFSRRYKPLSQMEHGGMGLVIKAHDKVLDVDVVLKFVGKQSTVTNEDMQLIKREGSLAMRLSHANIVRLHNVETEGGRVFIVMEFVDGDNLRQILQKVGRLSSNTVMAIGQCCAAALDYAHRQGILHKDLKPENIMIDRDNVLKIVDFGTADFMHKSGAASHIEGTPSYMSPEQIRGEPLDARSDVFALGAVLAESFSGVQMFPFRRDWLTNQSMEPTGLEMLPPAVVPVVLKAVAMRRDDRWDSAGEFVQALQAAMDRQAGVDTASSP